MNIALIAGAGYMGVCTAFNISLRPDILLPLGDETVLSRLITQLRELNFKVYVGAGKPGTLYPKSTYKYMVFKQIPDLDMDANVSPWMDCHISYIERIADEIVVIDQPDGHSMHDTNCRLIDAMIMKEDTSNFDKFMLVSGDYLFSNKLLQYITRMKPSQVHLGKKFKHAMWVLDFDGLLAYRTAAQEWRDYSKRFEHMKYQIEGVETIDLSKQYPGEWWEVDYPNMYVEALEWVKQYPL